MIEERLGDEKLFWQYNYEGAFFTAAVKEESSEIIHLDFNNDLNLIT